MEDIYKQPYQENGETVTPDGGKTWRDMFFIMAVLFVIISCVSWYQAHRIHVLERDLSVSIEMQKSCLK